MLVTHALDMARQLCDRAVMLDHGLVHAIGSPDEVVREMRLTILRHDLEFAREGGTREVEILGGSLLRGLRPVGGALAPGDCVTLQVDLKANEPVDDPVVSFAAARRREQLRLRKRHRAARRSASAGWTASVASGSSSVRCPSREGSTG